MGKPLDITGQRFGMLTAIKSIGKTKYGNYQWLFKCDCGNEHVASAGDVKNGRVKSCGCLLRKDFIDITGQKYGRLTAIRLVTKGSRRAKAKWLFRCECGNEIECTANRVRSGTTKSCGCLKREISSQTGKVTIQEMHKKQVTHGYTGTRIYRTYKNMKSRCYNLHVKCYPYYGGKGITVCDEWLKNPQTFIEWALTHGYTDNLTIERIDSDKGYSPDNCEFITQAEQARRALLVRKKHKRNVLNDSAS